MLSWGKHGRISSCFYNKDYTQLSPALLAAVCPISRLVPSEEIFDRRRREREITKVKRQRWPAKHPLWWELKKSHAEWLVWPSGEGGWGRWTVVVLFYCPHLQRDLCVRHKQLPYNNTTSVRCCCCHGAGALWTCKKVSLTLTKKSVKGNNKKRRPPKRPGFSLTRTRTR